MKIIAFYLPQFHQIPENDEWWGEGYTEWIAVKRAKPLVKGHRQPRIPLNSNYYNLTNLETLKWQAKIAKENGIYGFCYYHYWFDGKMLLEKPAELMLQNSSVDIPFCFCWANENWTNIWTSNDAKVLIEQTYSCSWKEHFYYLLQFFKDKRYIKEDNCPLFVIYRPEIIPNCEKIINTWQELAKQNGFNGIKFLYQQSDFDHRRDERGKLFSYGIEYQPKHAMIEYLKNSYSIRKKILNGFLNRLAYIFPKLTNKYAIRSFNYDELWNYILSHNPIDEKMIPGAFVDWDNTPRHGIKGSQCVGVTPEKFEKYLTIQIKRAKEIYRKDKLFIFAWNEWGEGGYLEPDKDNGFRFLNAIKKSLKNNNINPELFI